MNLKTVQLKLYSLKRREKKEEKCSDLWDTIKCINRHIMKIPEE